MAKWIGAQCGLLDGPKVGHSLFKKLDRGRIVSLSPGQEGKIAACPAYPTFVAYFLVERQPFVQQHRRSRILPRLECCDPQTVEGGRNAAFVAELAKEAQAFRAQLRPPDGVTRSQHRSAKAVQRKSHARPVSHFSKETETFFVQRHRAVVISLDIGDTRQIMHGGGDTCRIFGSLPQ